MFLTVNIVVAFLCSIPLTTVRSNFVRTDSDEFTSTIPDRSEHNDHVDSKSTNDPGHFSFLFGERDKSESSFELKEKNRVPEFDARVREAAYQKTEARENPYSVKLLVLESKTEGLRMLSHCSGSLVTLQWVLTAGHCLPRGALSVAVFAGATGDGRVTFGAQFAQSRRWFIHPNFTMSLDVHPDFDIALVKLPKPFIRDEFVRPIEVSSAPWDHGYRGCSVTAFGKVLINDSRPDDFVRKTHQFEAGKPCPCASLLDLLVGPGRASRFVCMRPQQDFGLCQGDSGGGLVCGGRLAGVASFLTSIVAYVRLGLCDDASQTDAVTSLGLVETATECGDRHTLTVFQDTHPSLAWIESTIIKNGASAIFRIAPAVYLVLLLAIQAIWLTNRLILT